MSTHSDQTPPLALPIRDEMIRLGQAIKLANIVEDGVEARELIQAGIVYVNDELETRRGRQLHIGDIVTVAIADAEPISFQIVSDDDVDDDFDW